MVRGRLFRKALGIFLLVLVAPATGAAQGTDEATLRQARDYLRRQPTEKVNDLKTQVEERLVTATQIKVFRYGSPAIPDPTVRRRRFNEYMVRALNLRAVSEEVKPRSKECQRFLQADETIHRMFGHAIMRLGAFSGTFSELDDYEKLIFEAKATLAFSFIPLLAELVRQDVERGTTVLGIAAMTCEMPNRVAWKATYLKRYDLAVALYESFMGVKGLSNMHDLSIAMQRAYDQRANKEWWITKRNQVLEIGIMAWATAYTGRHLFRGLQSVQWVRHPRLIAGVVSSAASAGVTTLMHLPRLTAASPKDVANYWGELLANVDGYYGFVMDAERSAAPYIPFVRMIEDRWAEFLVPPLTALREEERATIARWGSIERALEVNQQQLDLVNAELEIRAGNKPR